MTNDIIKIENLRRDFKVGSETVHALRGISFSIRAGEFVTIMGTSGSGKSTLQSYNLLPKTTALENVELPLLYNPAFSSRERREKAMNALNAVGLSDRINHRSNQMSGGQQQRVAIARAIVNDPVILLADEATGNLDTRTSFEILTLFQRLHAEGRTIIFVTHNPEIAQFSSRNIVLRDGHITEDTINQNVASAKEVLDALPKEND